MLQYLNDHSKDIFEFINGFFLFVAAGAAIAFIFGSIPRLLRIPGYTGSPIPVSYKIAVIGLRGAGKTTLITALFELIQKGVHVERVRLHGVKTITVVNRNILHLNAGEPIGPTKEKDTFVFRFSYLKSGFPKRFYDVEIADFPGEYSEKMSTEEIVGDNLANTAGLEFEFTLFDKEFYSWIATSSEYLFLIDLSSIYSRRNVRRAVAEITARIRTSWQIIEDSASDRGIGSAGSRPTHLIFTKVDSVVDIYKSNLSLKVFLDAKEELRSDSAVSSIEATIPDALISSIAARGSLENLSMCKAEEAEILNALKNDNDAIFSDLIQFFTHRTKGINIIYSSMVLTDTAGERLGVRQVLEACLP